MSCRSLTGRPVLLAHLATTILILTGERASAASRIENGLSAAAARSSADGVDSFLRGAVEEDLETSARATSDVTKGQVPRGSTRSATPWADSELDDDITANIHKSADSSATASASCVPEKLNAAGSKHDGKSKPCVLGVVLELLSCVGSNVGLVIEKQALMAEQNRLGKADVSATKLPLWWLGFAIFAVAQVPPAVLSLTVALDVAAVSADPLHSWLGAAAVAMVADVARVCCRCGPGLLPMWPGLAHLRRRTQFVTGRGLYLLRSVAATCCH